MKSKYPRGHFRRLLKEGKLKIEFASTRKISEYDELAAEFIEQIFGIDSFLITDESSLWDFRTEESKKEIWRRIQESYDIDVSDVKDGKLVQIFERIDWQRKPSC